MWIGVFNLYRMEKHFFMFKHKDNLTFSKLVCPIFVDKIQFIVNIKNKKQVQRNTNSTWSASISLYLLLIEMAV